ncbi:MAG: SulP family inorganic anion transporter [Bacteroidetes bacterium]|nr:MAG: SulP family inorganic anion transporter [Bacteroidota bacterium]
MNQALLYKIFPFLGWWPMVNRNTLRADFLAGITGAIIVLPQGVAFAMIAGMPPEYGLYTAMVTPVIAALFGSSFHLISGPTTAISIVVFAAISQFADPGSADYVRLALALTFMAGAIQLVLGLARMGTLINFVSHSVVIAFTAGAALLIATSQLKHVMGIEVPRGLPFLENWSHLFRGIGQTNPYVLAVGLGTLLSAILFKRFLPKLPNMLLAMVFGSVLSLVLDGEAHGVALVGQLPAHLPSPSMPDISERTIRLLAPNAFAIALLGLIEAVSIARAIATHTQQRIDGNQEFIGQGLSNLFGSFFSSYAGSGSFTRSGVNHQAGAKTPMAAVFAAVLLALVLLLVAPLTAYLPMPAMGGIILLVAYNLVDFRHIKSILKTSRTETAVLIITFGSTLLLELEFAIYIGVFLSLIFYLQRTSKPRIVEMAPNPASEKRKFANVAMVDVKECPQLKIIRIDGSLFFGAVDHIGGQLAQITHEESTHRKLLILASGINFLDMNGAELLVQEARRLRSIGGDLYIAGLKLPGRELMAKGGFKEDIGEDHFFTSKQEALARMYLAFNPQICASCQARIFQECETPPQGRGEGEKQAEAANG